MKVRTYGALTSAFLITLSGAAQAKNDPAYNCPPPKTPVHHAAARPAPARPVRKVADAEYTHADYDYNSAGAVSEILARRLEQSLPPQEPQSGPWQVAPNDGDIRFHYTNKDAAYGANSYAPPPLQAPVAVNSQDFDGGVGYGQSGGSGGGAGFQDGYGQVHYANGGGMNGGVMNNAGNSGPNSGYGPDRFGVWHGYNWKNGLSNGY